MNSTATAPATAQRVSIRTLILAGLGVSLLLAGVVSFYASGHPDGLEFVAHSLGFADSAGDHASAGSPMADYGVKGIHNARLSGGLAGIIGVVLVGLVMFALARVLRRRSTD